MTQKTTQATPGQRAQSLHDAEQRTISDLARKRGELADAKAALVNATTERYLDEGAPPADSRAVLGLAEAITALDESVDRIRALRSETVRESFKAEAATFREQALQAERRAAEQEKRTAALLVAIEEIEGVRFGPPQPQPAARMEDGTVVYGPAPVTRTAAEYARARSLEQQARTLESREVPSSGEADAASIDELLKLACGDPMKIGPRSDILRQFAADAATAERARYRRSLVSIPDGDAAPMTFHVEWRSGELVTGRCQCRTDTTAPDDLRDVLAPICI